MRGLSRCRRGSLYVVVLITSLIVSLGMLTGLKMATRGVRERQDGLDACLARSTAQSGLSIALARIASQADWDDKYPSAAVTSWERVGMGDFRFALTSPSGRHQPLSSEPIFLNCWAKVNRAENATQIAIQPRYRPHQALRHAAFASGQIDLDWQWWGSLSTDGTVHAASGYTGNTAALAAKQVGDPSIQDTKVSEQWIDYYTSIGVEIPLSSLTYKSEHNSYFLEHVLLSPNHNPFKTGTSSSGVYYIRANNQRIHVSYVRVVGTLILLDTAVNSSITDRVFCEPASPSMPTLLVKGSINFQASNLGLYESWRPVNYNPNGTPYRGASDSDTQDSYPSIIRGLVYATGDIYCGRLNWYENNSMAIHGAIFSGGTIKCWGPLKIFYDPSLERALIPGFSVFEGFRSVANSFEIVSSDSAP